MATRKNEAYWVEKAQRWQINVTNDDGKRKTFVCGTPGKKGKIAAERKADDWLENSCVNSTTRVEKMFDAFVAGLKARKVSYGYWQPYESIGATWVKPAIGTKRVGKMSEHDLEAIVQTAFDAGRSERYLRNIKICLMAFLKYCRKCKATTLHPEEFLVPKGAPKSDKTSLQPDEIKVLFASDRTNRKGKEQEEFYIHAYRIFVLMGFRPGELIALDARRDVDEAGGYITVNGAINSHNERTKGKNENAHRRKKISALARVELDAQKAMLRRRGIISPYVFPAPDGRFISQKELREAWHDYCVHNKIGYRGQSARTKGDRYITPYELRHTHNSVNKEMPQALKKLSMGWSESFDGDAVYSHELDGDLDKIAQFTDHAFAEVFREAETK